MVKRATTKKRGRKKATVKPIITEEPQPTEPTPEPEPEPKDFTIFEASRELRAKEVAIQLWVTHGHLVLNARRNITAESLEKWKIRLSELTKPPEKETTDG